MKANHSRLLKSYVLSYLSIALLACAVVGLSLFYVSASQLNDAVLQNMQNELTLATGDLERQYGIMRDIAYRISTSIQYRSIYLDGGVSRKLRLMEDLAKYKGYSPIVDSYFFYRLGDRLVWKPNAANTLSVFAGNVLFCDDADLQSALNALPGDGSALFRLYGSRVLLLFPIHTDSNRSMQCDAVVGFLVRREAVFRRLQDVTAVQPDYPLHVYLQGEPLFSSGSAAAPAYGTLAFSPEGVLDRTGGLLGARSPGGLVSVAMEVDARSVNERLGYFRAVSLLVIAVSLLLLVALGYLIARHNYRPIGELARKYGISGGSENEIKRIDSALNSALEQNRMSESRMNEQLRTLRSQKDMLIQQFLLLILNGEYHAGMEKRAHELGVVFPGCYFRAFVVTPNEAENLDFERMNPLIHDLSDETMSCYCVRLKKESCFAVIVSAREETQFAEFTELLEALGEAEGVGLRIAQGRLCEDIRGLPVSLAYALSGDHEAETPPAPDGAAREGAAAAQIVTALRAGDLAFARARLNTFVDELAQSNPSFPYQHYMLSDLLVALLRSVSDLNEPRLKMRAGSVLLSGSIADFRAGMTEMLGEIHALIQENDSEVDRRMREGVMAFVRAHALDYDMGYDKLASEFPLPVKHLRHIIRLETGRSLREHMNALRVEHAKELLNDRALSITDIAQRVGYLNVSYFIKNFRTIAGVTPANYRAACCPA